jgi:hypothetical protein
MLAKPRHEGQSSKSHRNKRESIRTKACRRGRAKIIIESIKKTKEKILPNARNSTATNVTRPIWETVGTFIVIVTSAIVRGMFVKEIEVTGDRREVSTTRSQRRNRKN